MTYGQLHNPKREAAAREARQNATADPKRGAWRAHAYQRRWSEAGADGRGSTLARNRWSERLLAEAEGV